MTLPKAFLFDLNGTMIDDMDYHINAWFKILNGLGASLTLQQMKLECYGKNGELLERIFPGRFSAAEKLAISISKEETYQQAFRPHLALLPGLEDFIKRYYSKGIKMAIGSAAIMFNIDFVLDGLNIRHYFDVLVSADDVAFSKPHPATWLQAAEALQLQPGHCLVFEDNPKGVEAAARAGMPAMVLTTMHESDDFSGFDNVIGFAKGFTGLNIEV